MTRTARSAFKHLLENLGCRLTLLGASPPWVGQSALVIAWHNIVPSGEQVIGERSLHLPWRDFVAQLDLLEIVAEIVPLREIIAQNEHPVRRKLRVALTFDDAYNGAVSIAVPELLRRGHPFTLFVAPGLLDGASPWWDRLASAKTGVLDADVRRYALGPLRGQGERILSWARDRGLPLLELPDYAKGASATDVRRLADCSLAELGGHSWTHPNLSELAASELHEELARPLKWILDCGIENPIPLAYPYGLHSPEADQMACDLGYANAYRVEGGPLVGAQTRGFVRPRMNVPVGMTPAGFVARVGGWWPAQ